MKSRSLKNYSVGNQAPNFFRVRRNFFKTLERVNLDLNQICNYSDLTCNFLEYNNEQMQL